MPLRSGISSWIHTLVKLLNKGEGRDVKGTFNFKRQKAVPKGITTEKAETRAKARLKDRFGI